MTHPWNRAKTTRRYIHPPKSERMYTIWADGKLVFGDIIPSRTLENYSTYTSAGMWLALGDDLGAPDFHIAENSTRPDGIPIHSVSYTIDGIRYSIESFASFERDSHCYASLTVTNTASVEKSEKVGFVIRTAPEKSLVKSGPDLYYSFDTDIGEWLATAPTWEATEGGYTDGERTITVGGEMDFTLDPVRGAITASVILSPGASVTSYFCYTRHGSAAPDYISERTACEQAWKQELSRINKLPECIASHSEYGPMVYNLAAQLLQCFCYPVGEDFILARQGGLSRMMWPYESMPVLKALSRIGDFDDYIEPTIDMYFARCADESGEITPFGIHWAMCTANVLYSFAEYSKKRGRAYFDKYRDDAYRSFKWIKATRAATVAHGDIVAGIFPPRQSCDDFLVFQGWGNTDSFNLRGLNAIADAFEYFGDPAAEEMRREYNDYRAVMRSLWDDISAREDSDEIRVPFTPRGDDAPVEKEFCFGHFGAYLIEAIDIPETDVERIINYYTRRGFIKGGLYDRMPDKNDHASTLYNLDENGRCVVWYVTAHEYLWFLYFMRHGMRDRAREIIDDAIRYAMTDEYYMIERYSERDPYFAPWCPNASANGRLIDMLLDYYS